MSHSGVEVPMIEEIADFNEEFFCPFLMSVLLKNKDREDGRVVYISTFDVRNSNLFLRYDYGHPGCANETVQKVMRRLKYHGAKPSSAGEVKILKWRLKEIVLKIGGEL